MKMIKNEIIGGCSECGNDFVKLTRYSIFVILDKVFCYGQDIATPMMLGGDVKMLCEACATKMPMVPITIKSKQFTIIIDKPKENQQ